MSIYSLIEIISQVPSLAKISQQIVPSYTAFLLDARGVYELVLFKKVDQHRVIFSTLLSTLKTD